MTGRQVVRRLILLLSFVALVFGISFFNHAKRSKHVKVGGKSSSTEHLHPPYDRYGVLGMPVVRKEKQQILYNIGYVVGYSEKYRLPLWCSYRLGEITFPDQYKRYSSWHSDSRVKNCPDPRDYQYKISKKHRGHLAPSFAMSKSYGTLAMIESFNMTNSTPMSEKLNSGVWAELENRTFGGEDSWANMENEVWVICGPILGENPKTIGNRIALPKEYFKILLIDANNRRLDENDFKILAFRFPEEGVDSKSQLKDYLCSVLSIELDTGIDFFSELNDEIELGLETVVELDIWK